MFPCDPFCRPKPRTSDTVRPVTPSEVTRAFTSSSWEGLITASIRFIFACSFSTGTDNPPYATRYGT